MLGRCNPQRSLLRVPFWAQGLVPEDSFYTRMGRFWSRISKDEDLAEMKGHRLGAILRKLLNPQFDAALITYWTVIED